MSAESLQHIVFEPYSNGKHGLCDMVEAHVVYGAFQRTADPPLIYPQTLFQIGATECSSVPIALLPSYVVIGGNDPDLIGHVVLPEDNVLYHRPLAMNTLVASLRKSKLYIAREAGKWAPFLVTEIIRLMQERSLKYEDITNNWVLDAFRGSSEIKQ